MKSTIACLLILALVVPAFGRQRTPQDQLRKLSRGSSVTVTLKDKRILTGYLSEIAPDRFLLGASVPGDWSGEVLLQDVANIRENKPRLSIKEILLVPVWVVWWLGYLLWYG
jgi:hypothetical protein